MTIVAPQIDEDVFVELFELAASAPWTERKSRALVELWNLYNTVQERDLLKLLIQRFRIINDSDIEDLSAQIAGKFDSWGLDPTTTMLAATADKGEVDGSVMGLQSLKVHLRPELGWSEKNLSSSMFSEVHNRKDGDSLIIFDDFIGSGKTIRKKLKWVEDKLDEIGTKLGKLAVVGFVAMGEAYKDLEVELTKKGIEIYCPLLLSRGISDHHDAAEAAELKNLMTQMESLLQAKVRGLRLADHSLGYRSSETLMSMGGTNCPNNVFPIFWWPELDDNEPRNTMFRRLR
ncbi:MAG: hypothetical protein JJ934_13070 [Pseudomonadales bacterium]|nr:hypothetical protein [Pseudomonadales bacterium]